jgi:hypothetical protein
MYHIVLLAVVLTLSLGIWNLVQASPRSIGLFLSPFVAFTVGAFFLCFGIFFAYLSAYPMQNAGGMIGFFIQAYVGVWLLLAHLKGDERTVRQTFMMVGTLMLTIVAIYYVQDHRAVALLTLLMIATGYWLTVKHMRFLDGGR